MVARGEVLVLLLLNDFTWVESFYELGSDCAPLGFVGEEVLFGVKAFKDRIVIVLT